MGAATEGLIDRFGDIMGVAVRPRIAVAPGRVNLIGEHTDYNDGFVLPMAIDRQVAAAFVPRDDRIIRAFAIDYNDEALLDLDQLRPGAHEGWSAYVAGVAWAMERAGLGPRGMDLVIRGHVPIGAGLSSSAALEMAVARAQCAAAGVDWEPAEMAQLGRRAENEYVGVSSGIMDQFASAASVAGCALLLDCRSLETGLVPVPDEAIVVVIDTGVRRSLAKSAYNDRSASCERATAVIRLDHPQVRALRDVSPELLGEYRSRLDPVVYRRASHVVGETARPREFAAALRCGELDRAGELMYDSHESLRDLYEVSCDELDFTVDCAREHPACFGARLTGAGFGGCAVALVRRSAVDDFMDFVGTEYRARFDHPSTLHAFAPAGGARILDT